MTSSKLLLRCKLDCTHSLAKIMHIMASAPTSLDQPLRVLRDSVVVLSKTIKETQLTVLNTGHFSLSPQKKEVIHF